MSAIDNYVWWWKQYQTCIFNNKNDTFQVLTNSPTIGDQDKIIIGIPYIFLTVFVLTSNLLLIYGFYKTSRPFSIITKLFIYLSLVDITLHFMLVFTTSVLYINERLSCLFIYIVSSFTQLTYFLGVGIFATISFLRYWSIKKPLHSTSGSRIVVVLIVQGIVCGIFASSVMALFYSKLNLEQMVNLNYYIPISQFLAVSFVLSVNLLSYKKLKSMKRMVGLSNNVGNTQRQKTLSEANTCLLCITIFYFMCPLPLSIYYLFQAEIVLSYNWRFYIYTFAHVFYMSNNGINSLIFILRTKNLRGFYKRKCCFSRLNRSLENQNTVQLANF